MFYVLAIRSSEYRAVSWIVVNMVLL